MSLSHIKLPINIVKGVGAYTTRLFIGSEQTEIYVMLDTGSSTLAIDLQKYQPKSDQALVTTIYAQDVVYGQGGWAGPVINTQIRLDHSHQLQLKPAPLAITSNNQQNNFQNADGIWGLAYHHLNKAYDVSEFLAQQDPKLQATYPWPFTIEDDTNGIADFKKYLRGFPEQDITPLFTAFEEHQIIPNQFALQTHRSIVYQPNENMTEEALMSETLNQGSFYIGYGVADHHDTYQTIQVLHDAYYNTHLESLQVAGFDACPAPPLDTKHTASFFSNAIIDSGCSYLILQHSLYEYLLNCLKQINPAFLNQINDFNTALKAGNTYQNPHLNPEQWPEIYLTFSGTDKNSTTLKIAPHTYWQQHANGPDNWHFMLMNQLPHWPQQTICGLPLINSYLCVFDRSGDNLGLIHWVEKEADNCT